MSSFRSLALGGTILALAATAPAHAALTFNALTFNALTFNALAATGSAIADLNGVAVEGITLPPATQR
jgi:hypothetical protein